MTVKPRHPLAVALAALLVLIAVMTTWSWAIETGRLGYRGILRADVGTSHVLSLFTVIAIDDTGYTVARGPLHFEVHGDPDGLVLGHEVTAHVTVTAPRTLTEDWRVDAPGRTGKKWLGLLGLGITAGIAITTLRLDPSGLRIRVPRG